jgi:hypothetical protein
MRRTALVLVLPWWLSACAGGGDAPVKAAVAETPVKVAAEPVAVPAPRKAPAITDCPAVLDRPESGDRLIAGSCGPVTVRKGYRVESGTLTLEAGVQLAFEPGAELTVGYQQAGQLIVRGTAERPVLMTAAGAKVKGSWRGVYLYEHADGSEITGLHIEYGGEGIRGPIYVLAEDVRIDHSTIRDCLDVPVHVSQKGRLASFSGNTVLRPTSSVVMFVPPSSVPAIADDNKFPEGSAIHVLTGIVRERVRWNNPGVPYSIGGLIEIAGEDEDAEALVELSPGTVLKFDEDAYINVGYYRPGTLRAEGSAAQPIVFTALGEAKPGAWRGVNLYKNASASFSHVHFEYGSRRAEWGVLFANSRAALAVSDCTFRHNGGGVVLQGGDLRISEFARNKFEDSTPALDLSAQAYGALGEGLELDEAARVIVEGGQGDADGPLARPRGADRGDGTGGCGGGDADDRGGGGPAGPRRLHAGGRAGRRREPEGAGDGGGAGEDLGGERPPRDLGRDPAVWALEREFAGAPAAAQRGRRRGGGRGGRGGARDGGPGVRAVLRADAGVELRRAGEAVGGELLGGDASCGVVAPTGCGT